MFVTYKNHPCSESSKSVLIKRQWVELFGFETAGIKIFHAQLEWKNMGSQYPLTWEKALIIALRFVLYSKHEIYFQEPV